MTNKERNEISDILVELSIKDAFKYANEKNINPEVVASILLQEIATENVFARLEKPTI